MSNKFSSRFLLTSTFLAAVLVPSAAFGQCQSCVNSITLPATAQFSAVATNNSAETQLAASGAGYFSLTLTGVPGGLSIGNQTYAAWCASWFNAALLNSPGTYPVQSTYSPTLPTLYNPLNTSNNLKMINYILNNKQGTVADVQDAIWLIMTGNISSMRTASAATLAMVTAAQSNPNYIPNGGGVMAVIYGIDQTALANNPTDGGNVFQRLFLEVPVPTVTQQCSTCVNAITLPAAVQYPSVAFNNATLASGTGNGYFKLTLAGVPTGYSITNQMYAAWCVGWFNAALQNGPFTAPVYSTYGSNLPGTAKPIVSGNTFNMVNYILNNKQGTVGDVQNAIWLIMTGQVSSLSPVSAATTAMVNAAKANPTYCPPTGGTIGILLAVNTAQLANNPTEGGNVFQSLLFETICTGTTNQGTPGLTLKKTANVAKVNPFKKVTYTYVVTNTGTVPLTGVVVVDDNGTPTYKKDDFTVGTIASLAPGASATLTASIYPPVSEASNSDEGWGLNWGWNDGNKGWDFDDDNALPGGLLICKEDQDGKVSFTYKEDSHHTDNTYGKNASWDWGWWGHKFSSMASNDGAQFQVLDKDGKICLDFVADYVSPTTKTRSGWGTLGVKGGGGAVYKGDGSKILAIDTSLSQNLNSQSKYHQSTVDSPVSGTRDWDFDQSYTVKIDPSICGTSGFGGVKIPISHNYPAKWWGCDVRAMRPTSSTVTNTAVASVSVNGTVVSASAKATVTVDASRSGWSQCTKY